MKIIVGISGASGAIYAKRLLDFLKKTPHQIELTASENALEIGKDEAGIDSREYGFPFYSSRDFTAPFASGSAKYDGLVVIPDGMELDVGEFVRVRITDCDVHDLYAALLP